MIRRALARAARRERGLTLVELTIGMAVFGVIGAAMMTLLVTSSNISTGEQQATRLQIDARTTLSELAADFRQAYTGDATLPRIESISPVLTFYAPDRLTPMHLRKISYRFVDGELQRSLTTSTNAGGPPWTWPASGGPWTTEAGNLTSVTFKAYDSDDPPAPTTDPSKVKTLVVSLAGKVRGAATRTYTFQITAEVRPS